MSGYYAYNWQRANQTEITAERIEELAAQGLDKDGLAKAFGVKKGTISRHLQKVSKLEAYERGRKKFEQSNAN